MSLTVTEEATMALKQYLDTRERDPQEVLRLVSDADGNHGFQLDVPDDQDQLVQHEGETVMVVGPVISEELTGNTLGIKETPQGPTLTLYT